MLFRRWSTTQKAGNWLCSRRLPNGLHHPKKIIPARFKSPIRSVRLFFSEEPTLKRQEDSIPYFSNLQKRRKTRNFFFGCEREAWIYILSLSWRFTMTKAYPEDANYAPPITGSPV